MNMKRSFIILSFCCIALQAVGMDCQREETPKNVIIAVLRLSHDRSGRLRVSPSKNSLGIWQPRYDSNAYPSGWDLIDKTGKSLGCCIEFQAEENTDNLVLTAKHTAAQKAAVIAQNYAEKKAEDEGTALIRNQQITQMMHDSWS